MRNLLGRRYRVNQFGRHHYWYCDRKTDAMAYAKISYMTYGGEWEVGQIDRKGRIKRIAMVGGTFDEWPGNGDW